MVAGALQQAQIKRRLHHSESVLPLVTCSSGDIDTFWPFIAQLACTFGEQRDAVTVVGQHLPDALTARPLGSRALIQIPGSEAHATSMARSTADVGTSIFSSPHISAFCHEAGPVAYAQMRTRSDVRAQGVSGERRRLRGEQGQRAAYPSRRRLAESGRLAREAGAWEAGAEGERRVAEALSGLADGASIYVFHDRLLRPCRSQATWTTSSFHSPGTPGRREELGRERQRLPRFVVAAQA
jgi:hypothetical protein